MISSIWKLYVCCSCIHFAFLLESCVLFKSIENQLLDSNFVILEFRINLGSDMDSLGIIIDAL